MILTKKQKKRASQLWWRTSAKHRKTWKEATHHFHFDNSRFALVTKQLLLLTNEAVRLSTVHEVRQAKPKDWAKRVSNGDSDPRAKLKPEHLTRGRLFVGRFPVLRQQMKGLAQAYCQGRIVTNSPLFASLKKNISCGCKCSNLFSNLVFSNNLK